VVWVAIAVALTAAVIWFRVGVGFLAVRWLKEDGKLDTALHASLPGPDVDGCSHCGCRSISRAVRAEGCWIHLRRGSSSGSALDGHCRSSEESPKGCPVAEHQVRQFPSNRLATMRADAGTHPRPDSRRGALRAHPPPFESVRQRSRRADDQPPFAIPRVGRGRGFESHRLRF
jgi:hypothetical protein